MAAVRKFALWMNNLNHVITSNRDQPYRAVFKTFTHLHTTAT